METANNPNMRLHATVKVFVQGVGFRSSVEQSALALGVTGWVRNCWNGDVEVIAEGKRSLVTEGRSKLLGSVAGARALRRHAGGDRRPLLAGDDPG